MTVSTFYASSFTGNIGVTNPANAQGAPNGVFATSTATTHEIFYTGFGIDAVIPSGSTINSVTIGYRYTLTESRNNYSHSAHLYEPAGNILGGGGSDTGESGANSGGGTGATADVTFSATATVTNLRSADLRLRHSNSRTSGTRAFTYSLDSVWIEVDWTAPPIPSGTATGAYAFVGEALAGVMVFADDFNRANGGLGSNWVASTSPPTIVSNEADFTTVYNAARWSTAARTDLIQSATCTVRGTMDMQGPAVAMPAFAAGHDPSVESHQYYWLIATSNIGIAIKLNGFSNSTVASSGIAAVAGDVLRITWDGTIVRGYRNGVQIVTWTPTGGNILPRSSNPHVGFSNGNTGAGGAIDNWSGGYFDPPPIPAGVASGTYTFTGAAVGDEPPNDGTASGTWGFTGGSATGTDNDVRINLLPNPSLETNTTGWANHSNASINNPTTTSVAGTRSLSITNTTVTTSAHAKYDNIPVEPNTTYNFSVSGRADNSDMVVRTQVFYFTSGAVADGNSAQVNTATGTSFVRGENSFTTGASTTNISLRVIMLRGGAFSMSAFGYTIYVDAMLLEKTAGAAGSYFDGATAPTGYSVSWQGTAHNSTSAAIADDASIPDGSATGSWAFAGAAAGKREPKGTGSGTFTFAGAATGKRTPKATGAGTFTFAGSASGKRDPKATASGTFTFTGVATGDAPVGEGVASGSYAFAGSASGKRDPKATAAGTLTFTGSATGDAPVGEGAASGTFSFTGAASGKRTPKATATGTFTFTGVASGDAPVGEGTASGTFLFTGASTGKRTPKATADGTWTFTSSATSDAPANEGSASGAFAFAGAAAGKRDPEGTASGAWSFTGVATGDAPPGEGTATGSYAFTGAATGDAPPGEGVAAGTFTFTGSATGVRTPKATATGTFAFTGAATGDRPPNKATASGTYTFTGAATGTTTKRGTATGSYAYTGFASGGTQSTGFAAGTYTFTGSATGYTVKRGTATGTFTFAGSATGRTTKRGTATGTFTFTGSAAGKRTPKATAGGSFNFAGTAVGDAPADPNEGTASGTTTWSGTATGKRTPKATAGGIYTYAGTAQGKRVAKGTASGATVWVGAAEAGARRGTATGTWGFVGSAYKELPYTVGHVYFLWGAKQPTFIWKSDLMHLKWLASEPMMKAWETDPTDLDWEVGLVTIDD